MTQAMQQRDQPPTVSVVICAYTEQRWDQLRRAVTSVHSQTRPVYEIVVVVDHNAELLRMAQEHLRARVVPNTQRQGLSGGRNTGVAAAAGDVVAFLDDDAYAEPEWVAELVAPYADPHVVAVGGYVRPEFDAGRPRFLPPEFDWVVGCSYRGQPEERADVRNVIGANMSFRRSVLLDVGGFELSLGRVGTRPLGCEETELCIRATAATPGGRVVLQPSARVAHQVPPARGTWSYFFSRCYSEGLSKAAVARLAGTQHGLASERAYVTRTLPAGALRGVRESIRARSADGLVRSSAIVGGLAATSWGYAVGRAKLASTARSVPAVSRRAPAERVAAGSGDVRSGAA